LLGAVAAVVGFAFARRSPAAGAKPAGTAANGYGGSAAGGGSGSGSGSGGSGSGSGSGTALAQVSQLGPGSGVVDTEAKVVVTSDAAGNVHAFSAVCTHQGCLVSSVSDGRISCPCHGSVFDAATGAVVQGPATQPLAAVSVVVRDGAVVPA
jgi:Rieske Fe-S protein